MNEFTIFIRILVLASILTSAISGISYGKKYKSKEVGWNIFLGWFCAFLYYIENIYQYCRLSIVGNPLFWETGISGIAGNGGYSKSDMVAPWVCFE